MEINQNRNMDLQKKLCCLVTWTLCLQTLMMSPVLCVAFESEDNYYQGFAWSLSSSCMSWLND